MSNKEKYIPEGGPIVLLLVFVNALILKMALIENNSLYNALFITIPSLLVAIYVVKRDKKVREPNLHTNINRGKSDDENLSNASIEEVKPSYFIRELSDKTAHDQI